MNDQINNHKQNKVRDFFKAIKYIISNKKDTNDQLTKGFFAILVSSFFKLLFYASVLFDFIFVIASIKFSIDTSWNTTSEIITNIILIVMILVIVFLIFLFGVIFKGISNELENNDDKNYIISVFSAVTGFIALIIAIIALIHGIV